MPTQKATQDFPEGGTNSQSGCANQFFLQKTAWKWKNLDRGSVPGIPLGSANASTSQEVHANPTNVNDNSRNKNIFGGSSEIEVIERKKAIVIH